jgi:hypothetical protein
MSHHLEKKKRKENEKEKKRVKKRKRKRYCGRDVVCIAEREARKGLNQRASISSM